MYLTRDNLYKGGVYAIRNLVNGREYIGVAHSGFMGRSSIHRWGLRHGRHHCRALQADWDKYGEQAFSFVVLDGYDISDIRGPGNTGLAFCKEREWYYRRLAEGIDLYNTMRP